MPYKIIHKGNKHIVINKETGKVKGTHDAMHKAMAQMRLLYGVGRNETNGRKRKTI